MKKLIVALVLLSLVTVLLGACGSGSGSGGSTDVHMNGANFLQPSVTISKSTSINLIDDVLVTHDIQSGSWDNGMPKKATEPGVPPVNAQFAGNDSHMIGPFNTAGTYHLYCTIHAGMNLTVVVR